MICSYFQLSDSVKQEELSTESRGCKWWDKASFDSAFAVLPASGERPHSDNGQTKAVKTQGERGGDAASRRKSPRNCARTPKGIEGMCNGRLTDVERICNRYSTDIQRSNARISPNLLACLRRSSPAFLPTLQGHSSRPAITIASLAAPSGARSFTISLHPFDNSIGGLGFIGRNSWFARPRAGRARNKQTYKTGYRQ
jgi:hypothetical protein